MHQDERKQLEEGIHPQDAYVCILAISTAYSHYKLLILQVLFVVEIFINKW
jgi:hypothetical protein